MNGLRITTGRPALMLPADETVTQTFGILAKRGAGKTYTAAVMVEELLKVGHQVVVVDPLGVWWGLRAGAGGQGEGHPIIVLGGDHGDVPLEETGGELVADLAGDGVSVVLDLSHFRKNQARRFMLAFSERLFHKKKRDQAPLHLVLDEADLFIPQGGKGGPSGDMAQLVGAIEDIVRRGRAKGIGVTLITQRSAVIHKDVLTQIDTLIVLRTTGPQDRKAIEAWVNVHGDEEGWRTMLASLASLPIGTAWVWSPGWLGKLERVRIRERETFDSSATPKAGSSPRAPRHLADVDLGALQERMAATIERAKADDPRELRRQVAELRKRLAMAARPTEAAEPVTVEVEVPVTVEVPVFPEELLERLEKALAPAGGVLMEAQELALKARMAAEQLYDEIRERRSHSAPTPGGGLPVSSPRSRDQKRKRDPLTSPDRSSGFGPSKSQQRILDALAWMQQLGIAPGRKVQVALLAGASPKSSAYGNNLGALRSAGLIEYPGPGLVALTEAGDAVADAPELPATTGALQAEVFAMVGGSKARILRVLIAAYPNALPKLEVAEKAEQSPTSSAFGNNLGALRSLGLIDYPQPGWVAAESVLFLEGA